MLVKGPLNLFDWYEYIYEEGHGLLHFEGTQTPPFTSPRRLHQGLRAVHDSTLEIAHSTIHSLHPIQWR